MLEYQQKRCPVCGSTNSFQRHGAMYDHERLCSDCRESWDPLVEYQRYLTAEIERLTMNTHRD